jgi:regulation of enolase protein 1 (concanavalin A-like superfamily)
MAHLNALNSGLSDWSGTGIGESNAVNAGLSDWSGTGIGESNVVNAGLSDWSGTGIGESKPAARQRAGHSGDPTATKVTAFVPRSSGKYDVSRVNGDEIGRDAAAEPSVAKVANESAITEIVLRINH